MRCLGMLASVLAAFSTALLFAISTICGYESARRIGGTTANFWRISFATGFLTFWAYTLGTGTEGSGLPFFVWSGVVGIGLGDTAYFQSLPRLGPRFSMLLVQCLTPPFGALIEWLWLGTRLTLPQIFSGLMILIGIGIALLPGDHIKFGRRKVFAGTLAGILAALFGAGGAVLSRKAYLIVHAHGEHIDAMTAGFQRVLGGFPLGAICLLVVRRREPRIRESASSECKDRIPRDQQKVWGWILLNSLAGQTFGVSCLQWALETNPTGVVLPIVAVSPIMVIPLAFLIQKEIPTRHSILGATVAVAGVIALTLLR